MNDRILHRCKETWTGCGLRRLGVDCVDWAPWTGPLAHTTRRVEWDWFRVALEPFRESVEARKHPGGIQEPFDKKCKFKFLKKLRVNFATEIVCARSLRPNRCWALLSHLVRPGRRCWPMASSRRLGEAGRWLVQPVFVSLAIPKCPRSDLKHISGVVQPGPTSFPPF